MTVLCVSKAAVRGAGTCVSLIIMMVMIGREIGNEKTNRGIICHRPRSHVRSAPPPPPPGPCSHGTIRRSLCRGTRYTNQVDRRRGRDLQHVGVCAYKYVCVWVVRYWRLTTQIPTLEFIHKATWQFEL